MPQQNLTVSRIPRRPIKWGLIRLLIGTALQIYGTVSPQGGNYTVKLDNVTSQFSANASFIQNNTLLFFASALNTDVAHDVQISNNGGTLILPFNGFVVYSSGDPKLVILFHTCHYSHIFPVFLRRVLHQVLRPLVAILVAAPFLKGL